MVTREDLSLTSHGARLSAWRFRAATDAWAVDGRRPLVVMAHGFGCTKDSALPAFAERFAAAGADCLVFDYRGFGTSEGEPRQSVDHRRHREDYLAVLSQVRDLPEVDPDRVVLWGTSYSGGHVVAVAAETPWVAGVVAQGAAMDGRAAVLEIARYAGVRHLLKMTGLGLRGVLLELLRRPAPMLPIVGEPGTVAAISSPDALPGYTTLAGPTFENRLRASNILPISLNRPVAKASKVTAPMLLVIAERDLIAPPRAVEKVAEKAGGPVRVERLDVGHFEIYAGEVFERTVAAEVDFLREVVGATASV